MVKLVKKNLEFQINNGDGESLYPRAYVGLSANGTECLRSLQYSWRWTYKRRLVSRINRLFRVGEYAEDDIIKELTRMGCKVTERQKFIESLGGHWLGHIDGIIQVPNDLNLYLLEIKTHNQKNFNALVKHGIAKAFPSHYDQMQAYMSHEGIPKKGMYIAICKNNSAVHIAHLEFDPERARELERIRMDVITSDYILPRIDKASMEYYKCRFCEAVGTCFEDKIEMNCRTCRYVDIMDQGVWHCSYHHCDLHYSDQIKGCDDYELDREYFKV